MRTMRYQRLGSSGLKVSKPVVTAPIVVATRPCHLEHAIAAVEVTLSEDEVARLSWPG